MVWAHGAFGYSKNMDTQVSWYAEDEFVVDWLRGIEFGLLYGGPKPFFIDLIMKTSFPQKDTLARQNDSLSTHTVWISRFLEGPIMLSTELLYSQRIRQSQRHRVEWSWTLSKFPLLKQLCGGHEGALQISWNLKGILIHASDLAGQNFVLRKRKLLGQNPQKHVRSSVKGSKFVISELVKFSHVFSIRKYSYFQTLLSKESFMCPHGLWIQSQVPPP